METKIADTKQQHPAEPWRIVPTQFASISIYAADNDELPVANTASNGSPKNFGAAAQQRREATARRIVACVNELAGVHEVTGYVHRLEDQRDKLLAALKALMDDNTGGTWGLPASHKDTIAARAIIAEIEAAK